MKNNLIVATLLVSLIPIFAHKKIYWFRNYQSRKARILLGLFWFFVPSNMVGGLFHNQNQNKLIARYNMNQDVFTRMLYEGDVEVMNPRQRWSEY